MLRHIWLLVALLAVEFNSGADQNGVTRDHTDKPENVLCIRNAHNEQRLIAVNFSISNPESPNLYNYSNDLSVYYNCTGQSSGFDVQISKFECIENSTENSTKVKQEFSINYICGNCETSDMIRLPSELYEYISYVFYTSNKLIKSINISGLTEGLKKFTHFKTAAVEPQTELEFDFSNLEARDLILIDLYAKRLYFKNSSSDQTPNQLVAIDLRIPGDTTRFDVTYDPQLTIQCDGAEIPSSNTTTIDQNGFKMVIIDADFETCNNQGHLFGTSFLLFDSTNDRIYTPLKTDEDFENTTQELNNISNSYAEVDLCERRREFEAAAHSQNYLSLIIIGIVILILFVIGIMLICSFMKRHSKKDEINAGVERVDTIQYNEVAEIGMNNQDGHYEFQNSL